MPFISSGQTDLVVFSHLRWDFVFQRPQQLMSRFAKKRRILFIEEPISEKEVDSVGLHRVHQNVWVLKIAAPRIVSSEYYSGISSAMKKLTIDKPMFWLYSPSFLRCALRFPHKLLVYDCMDELSAFRSASAQLQTKERELLALADAVFTGGRSLFESKSKLHQAVYCFPSSVETKHFAKASQKRLPTPADMKSIPHPIVGFYGVLDERLNLSLLKSMAARMPELSFVMIGPVAKINPNSLPRMSNIFYLGMKGYSQLPQYLQQFDVAFMPFAINRSTQFISPTKTLEFMAAHKPIVSTPITDVVREYASIVKISSTPKEMESAIRTYLAEDQQQRQLRERLENEILKRTSWDNTAADMDELLQQHLEAKEEVEDISLENTYSWELSNAS